MLHNPSLAILLLQCISMLILIMPKQSDVHMESMILSSFKKAAVLTEKITAWAPTRHCIAILLLPADHIGSEVKRLTTYTAEAHEQAVCVVLPDKPALVVRLLHQHNNKHQHFWVSIASVQDYKNKTANTLLSHSQEV